MLKQLKKYVWKKYFQSEQLLIDLLTRNNEDMKDIAIEQINHIHELQDKVAVLEMKEEDLELELEAVNNKLYDVEKEYDDVKWELENLQDENTRLQEQVWDLQYELQNKEEF